MRRTHLVTAFALALPLALGACAIGSDDHGPSPYDDEFPVSDLDSLLSGAPSNDELPDENKADARYPRLHTDLLALQSPVKSQGSRGVCSIFSTVALMEHLYIKEGTIANPDFSEQFLQWSAKFEVNSFPNTDGSNNFYNLQAISRYGIVREVDWPYESFPWGPAQDPACEGDSRPTYCYTNGQPPASALEAPRYTLPAGRWLNTNSIKAHMTTRGTAVAVGMTFFYQSWNHRRSELPINNEYWRQGIVLYPNAEDRRISLENRAGHAILLVGWDDDLEVQIVDEEGNKVFDADGEPVTEKGFYIFKNSWGTGSFGVDNPHGDGYGYISMRYVREEATAYISDLPTVELPVEICDDGIDNSGNGLVDCDDPACTDAVECQPETQVYTFTSDESVAIPDNDPVGVSTTIDVDQSATIGSLSVTVDITHTYRGDLRVALYRGDEVVVLHDRTGGYLDDLNETYTVTAFDGTDMSGEWRLKVEDRAAYDVGTLNGWTLEILAD
jgi:hypothetical protein